jgi:hypothetical protein
VTGGLAVLNNRDFALYLGSRVCASIATQMVIMAVGWQVYHITGRVLDFGSVLHGRTCGPPCRSSRF